MSKNVPAVTFYTPCRVSYVEWVARRSAGDCAEFICQSQCTNGCTDSEGDGSIGKDKSRLLNSWLRTFEVLVVREESHK